MPSNLEKIQELNREIFRKTEEDNFWGGHGALRLAHRRYILMLREKQYVKAHGSAAGIYYAAYRSALVRQASSGNPTAAFWRLLGLLYWLWAQFLWQRLEVLGLLRLSPEILHVGLRMAYGNKRYEKAIQIGKLALAIKNISSDTRALVARSIAESYVQLKNIEAADAYYVIAFQNFRSLRRPSTRVRLLKSRGQFYILFGNTERGLQDLGLAEDIAKMHNLTFQLREIKSITSNVISLLQK